MDVRMGKLYSPPESSTGFVVVSPLGMAIKGFDDIELARGFREERLGRGIPVRILEVVTRVKEVE